MVISLERGADLHTAQLMPLPLTVSCSSKIQIGFTFLVPAHLGSPGQRAVKRMYVCIGLLASTWLFDAAGIVCGARFMYISLDTHTRLTALCPGLPRWPGTRKVKPICILLKQETVSGSGISCAICKSAHRSRQITTPAPHYSVFYRPDALLATQPTVSKHWRHIYLIRVGRKSKFGRSYNMDGIWEQ